MPIETEVRNGIVKEQKQLEYNKKHYIFSSVDNAVHSQPYYDLLSSESQLAKDAQCELEDAIETYDVPVSVDQFTVYGAEWGNRTATMWPIGNSDIVSASFGTFEYPGEIREFMIVMTEEARDPPIPKSADVESADLGVVVRHELAHACEMIEEGVSRERSGGHQQWLDRLDSV